MSELQRDTDHIKIMFAEDAIKSVLERLGRMEYLLADDQNRFIPEAKNQMDMIESHLQQAFEALEFVKEGLSACVSES